jgi:HEAT repeat protein
MRIPLLLVVLLLPGLASADVEALADSLRKGDLSQRRAAVAALAELGPEAEPALKELVRAAKRDKDPQVARGAYAALGKVGAPALKELVRLLRNKRRYPEEAARALGSMGPGAEPALKDLVRAAKTEGAVATAAVFALAKLGPVALDPLEKLMRGREGPRQAAAIRALGLLGKPAAKLVGEFAELLRTDRGRLGEAALYALERLGAAGVDTVTHLYPLLVDDPGGDRGLPAAAAKAMRAAGAAAVPKLRLALTSPREAAVTLALEALRDIGPPAAPAIPDVARMLTGKQAFLAVQVLGTLGGTPAVEALRDYAGGEVASQRRGACRALAKLGDEGLAALTVLLVKPGAARKASAGAIHAFKDKAIKPLLAAKPLDDDISRALERCGEAAVKPVGKRLVSSATNKDAARWGKLLGGIGRPAAAELLRILELKGGTPEARIGASKGLARLGRHAKDAVVPLLKLARKGAKSNERLAAISALGALGATARPALSGLGSLANKDRDGFVRMAARHAVIQIKGPIKPLRRKRFR